MAEKILYIDEALGGIARITLQMSVSTLEHEKMRRAIEVLGTQVKPLVAKGKASLDQVEGLAGAVRSDALSLRRQRFARALG